MLLVSAFNIMKIKAELMHALTCVQQLFAEFVKLELEVLLCYFIQNVMFFKMSCFSECHVFQNVMFFKMSCFSECHFFQNVTFFRMSLFSECHVFKNVMFFRMSLFFTCHVFLHAL